MVGNTFYHHIFSIAYFLIVLTGSLFKLLRKRKIEPDLNKEKQENLLKIRKILNIHHHLVSLGENWDLYNYNHYKNSKQNTLDNLEENSSICIDFFILTKPCENSYINIYAGKADQSYREIVMHFCKNNQYNI